MKSPSLPLLLLLLLFLLFSSPSYITTQPAFILRLCSEDAGNYTAGSGYQTNLESVLSSMAADTKTTSGFYDNSSGLGEDRVNAMGLCRGDVGLGDCRNCINDATRRILVDCPGRKEASGTYDFCVLRFSNRSSHWLLSPTYYMWNPYNASDPTQFNAALDTLLTRLRAAAAGGSSVRKFATGTEGQGFVTIYALVQCSPDLSQRGCDRCLEGATSEIQNCCSGRNGGRVINFSCHMRFETFRFYSETEATPRGNIGASKNTRRLVYILVPVVVGGAAVLSVFFLLLRSRWRQLKRSRVPLHQQISEAMSSDGPSKLLQFDFDTIKAATNNFVDGRKLGQGGFGAVYKGTLVDGQDIAVKRLSRHSRQGDLEFKNEGELVAKLQHRNLVRFLGFCSKGNERLLIYKFVPNASLDNFLFAGPNKRAHLEWERRYKIIGGIARGLVYLHEDSRLRIIHRDLKAGNILLDGEMNPKIADFGLARFCDLDETEGTTRRVVGTYGYMAPEYLIHGNFSIKSDVFSFGVLVLEIVSGQKNKLVCGGSSEEDLLTYAWKSWKNGTHLKNLVDPSLGDDVVSCAETITRCIHIGLLCVQKNADDRPTMASVAQMLTNYSLILPQPSLPAFFMQAVGAGESPEGVVVVASNSQSAGAHDEAAVPLSWNEVSMTELCPR